jgi:uncharacterized protein YfbU (UPF0304 family)
MPRVSLTPKDRLILANQYEILGLLTKDAHFTRLAGNLRDGHKWIYEKAHALEIADDLSDETTEHVLSILGIYSDLRDSYKDLADKTGIDERDVLFPGFDGNNEGELLHFAQALSQNGNYTTTIGEHAISSHMRTTQMYQRMIQEWLRLGKPRYPLSKEQVQALLAAKIHPDNR